MKLGNNIHGNRSISSVSKDNHFTTYDATQPSTTDFDYAIITNLPIHTNHGLTFSESIEKVKRNESKMKTNYGDNKSKSSRLFNVSSKN